jgi:cytosine/adenosine deaminase-related metal-dependent hydrolase
MLYRKLKGDKLFNGDAFLEDVVLILDEDGRIENIVAERDAGDDVEAFKGILLPGFINCHCHLELSHLKDVIPPHTGLVDFLISVVTKRGTIEVDKELAIRNAENEMYHNGITGVGDICNTIDAINIKKESTIKWHSLVEVINFYDANLAKQLEIYIAVLEAHKVAKLPAVLTPHAPYSISTATYKKINEATAGQIISIHNQETKAEDELFKKGSGDFLKLYTAFGDGTSPFAISGKSSLQTWLPYFTLGQTILIVHNTFIKEEDILFAKEHATTYGLKIVYCLCPNANLYIENALPPVDLLMKHNCNIVIGTDSYSSNWQLSIAAELKTLKHHLPHISLQTLLQWATKAGAEAMCWNSVLGSFEKGTKPGVVLLNEHDFTVKRIV